MQAAGLPLRVQRRAVGLARRQGAGDASTTRCRARIVLDNERCILCSRCVRFTREISKSDGLGIQHRGDDSLVRAVEDGAFDRDPYSDNVIDICPVGALLSRAFPAQGAGLVSRADAVGLPWVRARLQRPDLAPQERVEAQPRSMRPRTRASIASRRSRTLPSTGRGSATRDVTWRRSSSARAPPRRCSTACAVDPQMALARARELIAAARRAGGPGIELGLERGARRLRRRPRWALRLLRQDRPPAAAGRADRRRPPDQGRQESQPAGARALYPALPADARDAFPADCDLVLVWGEGCDFALLPPDAKVIHIDAWRHPENDRADVFMPISVQTERSGHYTNFDGVVSRFEACFTKPAGVVDAEALFAAVALQPPATGPGGRDMTQNLAVSMRVHRLRDGHADDLRHAADLGRAQAGGGDVGPHRRQPRVRAHSVHAGQAGLVGALPRHGRRPQDAAQGGLQAEAPTIGRLRGRAVGRLHARAAGVRRRFRSAACSTRRACSRARRLVRRPHLPDADRAARRRPAGGVRLRRPDDHRRDARRLVVGQQVLAARRPACRLADDLVRARHGPDGARPDPDLRHDRPRTRSCASSRGSCSASCRPGASSTSRSARCSS